MMLESITQSLLSDKAHETPETRALLQSAHLNFDHAASKFILHPALHELGHQLLLAYGIHPPDEPSAAWLYEMIASYFAYAYERAQPSGNSDDCRGGHQDVIRTLEVHSAPGFSEDVCTDGYGRQLELHLDQHLLKRGW